MIERPPLFARLALAVIILLIGSFIAWSAVTEIDEITRGDGKVIPVSKTQIVQSTEPGVVQEIAVQVGQVVSKGDLIIRLDDTSTTASLGESVARSRALQTQIARLEIEMAGDFKSDLDCPEAIAKTSPQICENENQLLRARRDNFRNKLSVLEERRQQRMKELDEAQANISRLEENLKIAQREEDLIAPMGRSERRHWACVYV